MSASHARHRRSESRLSRRRLVIVIALGAVVVAALVLAIAVVPSTKSPSTGAANTAANGSSSGAVTAASGSASTTTTTSLPPNNAVTVSVLNASETNGLAAQTGAALTRAGFTVSAIGNAASKIPTGGPSQIYYGAGGLPAAHTLANSLSGPVSYLTNAALTGNTVILWIADAQLTVTSTPTTSNTATSNTVASNTR
jgi:uncharacterized lipoprotein YbaY